MHDMILTLLILAVAVGWFSINGPMELPEVGKITGYVTPGDGDGETKLMVPGAGALAVTVAKVGAPEGERAQIQAPAQEHTAAPECAEEVTGMEGVSLFLIGYAAGVAAVLIGMFAGPAAARLWEKNKKNT